MINETKSNDLRPYAKEGHEVNVNLVILPKDEIIEILRTIETLKRRLLVLLKA
jgi:hypothetical protein